MYSSLREIIEIVRGMMRDRTAFFFLLVVVFSLLWFVWPWSWLVGVFIAGLVFLWSLFFCFVCRS